MYYYLFLGKTYYPNGGIKDLIGRFNTVTECFTEINKWLKEENYDVDSDNYWYHISDENLNIVFSKE